MSAHSPASRCFISFLLVVLLCVVPCESCYREIFFFFVLETPLLCSLPLISIQVFPHPWQVQFFANPAASSPHVHIGIIDLFSFSVSVALQTFTLSQNKSD